ncbi:hypothetical protein CU097_005735 [Rhizopus azygosporus]|uniref:Uncharacterized protein n=1 Tax=Rhizopus azygosporus TaxID=86630 RepID=A0A367K9B3_RHIAZ|nr:hypothetical protein CU097_005735 [Rhizopus azygosporus]
MSNNKNFIPTPPVENVLPLQVQNNSMYFSDNTEIMETDARSMATSELGDGESTDAIEALRLTLKNLTQKLARGVALNAPSDELTALQDEATRIKNCIFSPSSIANALFSSPSPDYQQPASRLSHLIPSDLPVWQWRGSEWKKDANIHNSVEDPLDSFALIAESNGLKLDKNWERLIPIKMNRDQRIIKRT